MNNWGIVSAIGSFMSGLSVLAIALPALFRFARKETYRQRILKQQHNWPANLKSDFEHITVANSVGRQEKYQTDACLTFYTYTRVICSEVDFYIGSRKLAAGHYCYRVYNDDAVVLTFFDDGDRFSEVLISVEGNIVEERFKKLFREIIASSHGHLIN